MYQEILKKKEALEQQKPFRTEARHKLRELNLQDCIYGDLHLDGTQLSRQDVEQMLEGKLVKAASLRECTFIKDYSRIVDLQRDCLGLGNTLDRTILLGFHRILTGKESNQPEVNGKLSELLRNIYNNEENDIVNAARLHCSILAIHPFEVYNEVMARVAMNYYLEEKGFLPVILGYSREEYLSTVEKCLRQRDVGIFVRGLERAVYNKLEVALQIVAEGKA